MYISLENDKSLLKNEPETNKSAVQKNEQEIEQETEQETEQEIEQTNNSSNNFSNKTAKDNPKNNKYGKLEDYFKKNIKEGSISSYERTIQINSLEWNKFQKFLHVYNGKETATLEKTIVLPVEDEKKDSKPEIVSNSFLVTIFLGLYKFLVKSHFPLSTETVKDTEERYHCVEEYEDQDEKIIVCFTLENKKSDKKPSSPIQDKKEEQNQETEINEKYKDDSTTINDRLDEEDTDSSSEDESKPETTNDNETLRIVELPDEPNPHEKQNIKNLTMAQEQSVSA